MSSFYIKNDTSLATLAHEGWHQYVNVTTSTPIPSWLNERLACYHEAIELSGRKPRFTPQRNTLRINSLRDAVQTDTLMSLREIVDTHSGEVISLYHTGATQAYYAQAWALVTFLRHGAGGRFAPALDRMLRDIADGTFPIRVGAARLAAADVAHLGPGEAAFRAYFEHAPDDLADAFYDHMVRIAGF